jgi:hypothetical protein
VRAYEGVAGCHDRVVSFLLWALPVIPEGNLSYGATAACGSVGLCEGSRGALRTVVRGRFAALPSRHAAMRILRKIPCGEDRVAGFGGIMEDGSTICSSPTRRPPCHSRRETFLWRDGRMWVGGVVRRQPQRTTARSREDRSQRPHLDMR